MIEFGTDKEIIAGLKSGFPKGAAILNIGGSEYIFDNRTGYLANKSLEEDMYFEASNRNLDLKSIGIKEEGVKDWFNRKYPKGFYAHQANGGYYLVSIDTNDGLKNYSTGLNEVVTLDFIKDLAEYVNIYKSKEKAMQALKAAGHTIELESNIIKAKCLKKIYKGNKIISYHIVYKNGNTENVDPITLKNAIASGKIDCVNLKLTSDGRLIDK